ncbi:MAG: hypothetical protein R3B54_06100 [Bdellovibrionota bacterium]
MFQPKRSLRFYRRCSGLYRYHRVWIGWPPFEMLEGTPFSARLYPHEIPVYEGFNEVVAKGILSSLHEENAKLGTRVGSALNSPGTFRSPDFRRPPSGRRSRRRF